jgi:hypothetical protein
VLALIVVVLPQGSIVALAVLILMGAWEWSQFAGFGSPRRAVYVAVAAAMMAGLWKITHRPRICGHGAHDARWIRCSAGLSAPGYRKKDWPRSRLGTCRLARAVEAVPSGRRRP